MIPHGNLYLLVMSNKDYTPVGFLCINDTVSNALFASSVKTESSFDEHGGGKS